MKIALTGNPNSGKTTMFNSLTGRNEKVGNWAGVTVEKKEHELKKSLFKGSENIIVVDLPGAYSMSPFTSEESITSSYVKNENPDVIINIVDSTNLSRSLFFTTQLLELGIPVVVALNKADLTVKKQNKIDIKLLSKLLNCPVVETVSTSSKGLKELIKVANDMCGKKQVSLFEHANVDLLNKEAVEEADRIRFKFVNNIVEKVEIKKVLSNKISKQDKIDKVLTNKWLGIPIFAVIMFLVFWISQVGPGTWLADGIEFSNGKSIPGLVTYLEMFKEWVNGLFNSDSIWVSILVEGIIGGFIAVVGFLPLVMIMYFLISLLEDCGYMARVSVVLDPIFKKVGLSGKSVIPFVVGTGCAVPGVMACRTIKDERERRATAMLAPFMPCGAKLPVIALFAGAFFADSPWIGPIMYFLGIIIIFFGALLVNLITANKNKKSYFIIELPEYKVPSFIKAVKSMCSRGWSYIVKAGTIILVCNFTVHLMQNFNWKFEIVEANESILHDIATPFGYLFAPIIGVFAWQLAAAVITGFIAKENVVGTLAVSITALSALIDPEELAIIEGSQEGIKLAFNAIGVSKVAALSYLMLNLFSPPCFATIGAMNSEMKSKKWLFAGIGLQLAVGFVISFIVFFFGTLFSNGSFGEVWMPILGWIIVLGVVITITSLIIKNNLKYKNQLA